MNHIWIISRYGIVEFYQKKDLVVILSALFFLDFFGTHSMIIKDQ